MNRGRTCGRGPRPAGCREWLGWELPDHLGGSRSSISVRSAIGIPTVPLEVSRSIINAMTRSGVQWVLSRLGDVTRENHDSAPSSACPRR